MYPREEKFARLRAALMMLSCYTGAGRVSKLNKTMIFVMLFECPSGVSTTLTDTHEVKVNNHMCCDGSVYEDGGAS